MQSAARITDLHACADAGPNEGASLQIEQGSPNILINGLPAARVGDPVSCRMATGSAPLIAEGSSTVSFNGKPAARMGDKISNGGSIVNGSGNVFIGDGGALISIADDVNVSFGNGCMVYLSCDPPSDQSKSERNQTLMEIANYAKASLATFEDTMMIVPNAINQAGLMLGDAVDNLQAGIENFWEDHGDDIENSLTALGPFGGEIPAIPRIIEGAAMWIRGSGLSEEDIVSGLRTLNNIKNATEAEGRPQQERLKKVSAMRQKQQNLKVEVETQCK